MEARMFCLAGRTLSRRNLSPWPDRIACQERPLSCCYDRWMRRRGGQQCGYLSDQPAAVRAVRTEFFCRRSLSVLRCFPSSWRSA